MTLLELENLKAWKLKLQLFQHQKHLSYIALHNWVLQVQIRIKKQSTYNTFVPQVPWETLH